MTKTTKVTYDASKYNVSSNAKATEITLDKDQQACFDQITTKSGKIRFLNDIGNNRASIAKHLNIRYQMVRNVLLKANG